MDQEPIIFRLVPDSTAISEIVKYKKNSKLRAGATGRKCSLPFKLDHVSRHPGGSCFLSIGCLGGNDIIIPSVEASGKFVALQLP